MDPLQVNGSCLLTVEKSSYSTEDESFKSNGTNANLGLGALQLQFHRIWAISFKIWYPIGIISLYCVELELTLQFHWWICNWAIRKQNPKDLNRKMWNSESTPIIFQTHWAVD